MEGIEHVELQRIPTEDPIGAIVALAEEVRASAIALDARRISDRLSRARYFVSLVGESSALHPLIERLVGGPVPAWRFDDTGPAMIRFGRGAGHLRAAFRDGAVRKIPITWFDRLASFGSGLVSLEIVADTPLLRSGVCFTVGPTPVRWPWGPQLDLILVDEADAHDVARLERWQGIRALVVDFSRSMDIDRALAVIDGLAIEAGAARVESQSAQSKLQLCLRLKNHLLEQQRALGRSPHQMMARINALTIARVLAESVLDARAGQPDLQQTQLAEWLALERTKFLMSTKADALVALDERLVQLREQRYDVRRLAAKAAHEISVDLIAKLWSRMRLEAEKVLAALSKRLLADLDSSLGDLGEAVPLCATAGLELPPIRRDRRGHEWSAAAGVVSQIADRLGWASRKRIETASQDMLIDHLETRSQLVVTSVLDDYDDARSAMEYRCCELIDAARESAQVAADLSREAQAWGADGLDRARDRLAGWSARLSDLVAKLN